MKSYLQILLQTSKVKADSLLVKVSVAADFKARVLENGCVVAPRGNGEIDNFRMRVVLGEECTSNAEGSCARDRLGNGNLIN